MKSIKSIKKSTDLENCRRPPSTRKVRCQVENFRPLSLLNIDSKVLEKLLYEPLFMHFEHFLTALQYDFVKRKSVSSSMLFLKSVYTTLYQDSKSEAVTFFYFFFNSFDKVAHFELLRKVTNMGVGGCSVRLSLPQEKFP